MSNLRDCLSDRCVDASKPSTSSTSEPFRSKSTLNNMIKKSTGSTSKSNPLATSRNRNQTNERRVVSQTFTNTSIADLTTQSENINIDIANETAASTVTARGMNAKKKEKIKNLPLKIPQQQEFIPNTVHTPSPTNSTYSTQQEVTSVRELFTKNIGPLYASTSSRYLENLPRHPNYQIMHEMKTRQMLKHQQASYQASFPTAPPMMMQPEPKSPQFLQNAMQHPLLSRSFSTEARDNLERKFVTHNFAQPVHPFAFLFHQTAVIGSQDNRIKKSSPKHNKNKKNNEKAPNSEDRKFESYLSQKEVEEGLKNNTFFEGALRINPKLFQHAYVSSTDRSEQDVLIDGLKNRNRALESDIVIVQLLSDCENEEGSDENKRKNGKVVFIKERQHTRTCIGTLKLMPDKNRQKALFIPRDHRVPRLNVPCTSWPDNFYHDEKKYENTLFLARIVDWTDTRFAIGIILCFIGQSGDMVSESRAILAQNDLDITPFGPEVRDLYPRLDYTIPEDEIKLREDCRKMCIFSIDPYNCRDIDDAVSCRELKNGNYEIGVHISDVAFFLNEGTILDDKVATKATTIYMVERAYHMLPDDLCMLCSLFPGVDKLAFSVFWEITKEAKVVSHRFSKTVIHSCCQLAYEHAQAVLDDKADAQDDFPQIYNGYKYEDVHKVIKTLGKIAAIMRTERFEGGALRIDQPKVSFRLSASNGLPDTFWIYESKESHQLIEEFMLLANRTVANRIYEDHPKLAFLRCHPPPSAYMLKQLAKALAPMGIELDISSAGDLHRSLLPHVGPENTDKGKAMVLNMLCAKPMTRAKYFCADGCDDDDFRHYALNVPLYTHFTSPIRRYADIMVHRLLAASLKFRPTPTWDVDKVRSIAAQCNKQKYNAKKAGEMSTELYTLKYIEMNSPLITDAVVVEIKEKYIDVIVVAVGLNRRIFFNNDFPGKFTWIKNDAGAKLSKMEVVWNAIDTQPEVEQLIEVFSILQVEMHKGDDMVKVETKLVRPS